MTSAVTARRGVAPRAGSLAVAALAWIFLTAALAGPVRAVLGIGIVVSTLLACGCACGVVVLARLGVAAAPSPRAIVLVLASSAVVLGVLWTRAFSMLPAWICSDAGVHVDLRNIFIDNRPSAYEGFVSLYGYTWLVEHMLGTNAYTSFSVGFTTVALGLALMTAWVIVRGLRAGASTRRAPILLAWCFAMLLLVAVGLPLLSYYQVDGYMAQVFGLLPLFAIWLTDASELPRARRLLLFAFGLVFARYTYGLVLGDLCILTMVVAVNELVGAVRVRVRVALAAALALVVVAGSSYVAYRFEKKMLDVIPVYGWTVTYDTSEVIMGAAIVVAALLLSCALAPALWKVLRVPVAIGFANTANLGWLNHRFPEHHYYMSKYNFHALTLLVLGVAAAGAHLISSRTPRRRARAGALVIALLGLGHVGHGLAPIYSPYLERVRGRAPFRDLSPLADVDAWSRIHERLVAEHKRFGGYLVAFGPTYNFMNAGLGYYPASYFEFSGVDKGPGACVFWDAVTEHGWEPWTRPLWFRRTVMELSAGPKKECRNYHARWDSTITRRLCGVCY